jgi:hypothetical protein
MLGVDKKALKILLNYYKFKSSSIWNTCQINDPDFEYAKKQGLMFDIVNITHDEAVQWLLSVKNINTKEKITDLFVSSLSTRQLGWRSGLCAYAISAHFPEHKYDPTSTWATYLCCDVCGDFIFQDTERNLNLYNLGRLSSGGWFGPTAPAPLAFYLSEINKVEHIQPVSMDLEILQAIFDCLMGCKMAKSLIDVEKQLVSCQLNIVV